MGTRELSLIRQVMAAMITNKPFNSNLLISLRFHGWSSDSVRSILSAIPRYFFLSARSVGRQRVTSRHRSPLRQRDLWREARNLRSGLKIGGPAAYRDPEKVRLGVSKAFEFYSWLESSGFLHNEGTCLEMARVLARACDLHFLWTFLGDNQRLIRASTVTAIIKVLGEEGLSNEALNCFYRMKQFHCKPDVQTYNVVIEALCRVGNLNRARVLLERMEIPGARYPPDVYTYTILISAYCKRGMQTGCRKAVRRRIWEANRMFRRMIFRGLAPDVVTYNCLIDGLCKTYRIERAVELYDDMCQRGISPNRITYNSFIRYFSAVNEVERAIERMRMMASRGHGNPTSSSYTPIIHALCEGGRATEARNFLVEMVNEGSIPREYTYELVNQALTSAGEEMLPVEIGRRIEEGMKSRLRHVIKGKPFLGGVLLDTGDGDLSSIC